MFNRRIALIALALTALLVACKKDKGGDSAEAQEYTARGIVTSVSDSEISMNHEAMPDFVNRQGKKVGMAAMTMPFGVAKGLDTSTFKVGDKVSFTFDVDFGRKKPTQIKSVKVLPPETELELADGSGKASGHEGHGGHEGHEGHGAASGDDAGAAAEPAAEGGDQPAAGAADAGAAADGHDHAH